MATLSVSIGTVAETTASGGNLTLTEPASSQAGDILVAGIAYRDGQTFSVPTGWKLLEQQSSGDTNSNAGIGSVFLAYCVRGSSAPDLTFTRTGGNVARGAIARYRPSAAVSVAVSDSSSNTLASNSATATTGALDAFANDLIVAVFGAGDGCTLSAADAATDPTTASGATDTSTAPSAGTWRERVDSQTTTGADTCVGLFDALKTSDGNTGTIQVTQSVSMRSAMAAVALNYDEGTAASSAVGRFVFADYGSLTVPLPSDLAADDLMIMVVHTGDNGVSTPSGWNELQDDMVNGIILWKIAGSSESAPSVSMGAADHIAAQILRIRGVDTFDPIAAASYNTGTGTSVTLTHGTPAAANSIVVDIVLHNHRSLTAQLSGWTNSSLTGLVEADDHSTVAGLGGGFAFATGTHNNYPTGISNTTATLANSATYSWHSIIITPEAGISGSGSTTLGAVTGSGASTLALGGAASKTLDGVTVSSTSALAIAASAAATLGALVSIGAGTLSLSGAATSQLEPITAASAGALLVQGTASSVLDAITTAGGSTLSLSGAADSTLEAVTTGGAGSIGDSNDRLGTANSTLEPVVGAGSAQLALAAAGTGQLDALTTAGEGDLLVQATGASVLEPVTGVAGAQLQVAASGIGQLEPVTSAGAGTLTLSGSGSATLDALVVVSASTLTISGVGAVTLGAVTSQGLMGETVLVLTPADRRARVPNNLLGHRRAEIPQNLKGDRRAVIPVSRKAIRRAFTET